MPIFQRILLLFLGEKIKISGDGEEKLDFTYIEDLISGIIKCIKINKSKNQIFNLTYGKSEKIIKLIHILNKYFNNIDLNYIKRDKLVPKRGTLSVGKAKKMFGYNPKWPLSKGFVKYLKWYLNFYRKKI